MVTDVAEPAVTSLGLPQLGGLLPSDINTCPGVPEPLLTTRVPVSRISPLTSKSYNAFVVPIPTDEDTLTLVTWALSIVAMPDTRKSLVVVNPITPNDGSVVIPMTNKF